MDPAVTLRLRLPQSAIARFAPLFGAGVGIETTVGISLMSLLCDQLAIDSEYVDQRIQTLFVNSRPVDRIDQVIIRAGDVIALSAAMPGLMGATLRKGGFLAAFRKDISHECAMGVPDERRKTRVTLKLFNLVAKELAPHLLRCGVYVQSKQIAPFIEQLDTADGHPEVFFNDRPLSLARLPGLDWPQGWILLHIEGLPASPEMKDKKMKNER